MLQNISRVGLGTFPFTGAFNEIKPRQAQDLIKLFISEGGYYIDTAPAYGQGEIEKLLGDTLKDVPRQNYYLITKTVKHVDGQGRAFTSGKYKDVILQIDNSLKRLQTDYVDLLMVHSPDANTPIEETLQAMTELQNSGKVKELAVSNVDLNELKKYNRLGSIRYVENRFSLINRSINKNMEEYFLNNKIHLIPYHLLEIGLLTGKVFDNLQLREGDLRNKLPYWNSINKEIIGNWVRNSLAPLARDQGITIGQLNIAWALKQNFIKFAIVGTTNIDYLKINLKADRISLNNGVLQQLEQKYRELETFILQNYHQTVREFRGLNEKYY